MHLLYKKQGETCLECLQGLKNDLQAQGKTVPVSMTYAGRLDPLAAGLLIVLEDDEIKEKEAYLGLKKTYEFEVVFGVATDTFDQLGIVVSDDHISNSAPSKEFLSWPTLSFDKENAARAFGPADLDAGDFKKLIGKVHQSYPFFSSKTIGGVPLFQYVKDHGIAATIPKLPTNDVEIYDIEVIGTMPQNEPKSDMSADAMVEQSVTLRDGLIHHIAPTDLAKESIAFAEQIKGDFRQGEILESWKKWLAMHRMTTIVGSESEESLKIMKFRMTVSSGFYIRSFAAWLGQVSGEGAIARNIVRTRVGDLSLI